MENDSSGVQRPRLGLPGGVLVVGFDVDQRKIDGMVALAMAMGAYMIDRAEGGSTESVYNDRDIFFL